MTKEALHALAEMFMEVGEQNRIPSDHAIDPAVVGMRLYDAPILGFRRR